MTDENQDKNNKLGIGGMLAEWVRDLLYEEYEITVWFCKETLETEHGLKVVTSATPKIYSMRDVTKHSQTHIKGKDINGNAFELKTTLPFDYNIRKIH